MAEAVARTARLISIVEDDQPFRESMRKLVTLLGYTVEAFGSAADFLKSPVVGQTDCLLADVHMPGMTGVELLESLAASGRTIPAVASLLRRGLSRLREQMGPGGEL